jgi:uncharacterized repeat protein (TIGR03803 family)
MLDHRARSFAKLILLLTALGVAACGANVVGPTGAKAGTGLSPSALSLEFQKETPLSQESVFYTFQGKADGGNPYAGLLAGNSAFYGTTFLGGAKGNYGTVFELSPSGAKTILYTFQGGTDGANPQAGLMSRKGVLYGDTAFGGDTTQCPKSPSSPGGCGTVFALTPSGSGYGERVIYAFQNGSDGNNPVGGLLSDNRGDIYGTTVLGGGNMVCAGGCGIVFKLSPSGSSFSETVLYRFQGGADGEGPRGTLIADTKGALYGTTEFGGSGTCSDPSGVSGCGTVFKLTPSPSGYAESVIYSFQGGSDGQFPRSALLAGKKGAFLGATVQGGPAKRGTLYKLTPSGLNYSERVIYAFKGAPDGQSPSDENGLYANDSGVLFGTTSFGGKAACGCGTVFEAVPSGSSYAETVLHSFKGGSDGSDPRGSVIMDAAGALYGTAFTGATKVRGCTGGCGVVFKLSP